MRRFECKERVSPSTRRKHSETLPSHWMKALLLRGNPKAPDAALYLESELECTMSATEACGLKAGSRGQVLDATTTDRPKAFR
jgi:hypothetical protein